jgi:DNA-binding NarL/FixJ family response regulator
MHTRKSQADSVDLSLVVNRRNGSKARDMDPTVTPAANSPADTIRVAIVDDHAIARYGVEHVLGRQPGFEIVCSVDSLDGFEHAQVQPDVVVLDLLLSDGRLKPDRIAGLAARYPVLMLSAKGEYRDIVAAVGAGASGYLTKGAPDEDYIDAVRTVAAGDFFLSPQLADAITAHVRKYPDGSPVLSPREQETLYYVAQGLTLGQAARRMAVAQNTVEAYVKRIRGKIGPGTLVHLVLKAIQLREIDPETPPSGER